jgi:hypothetical protein
MAFGNHTKKTDKTTAFPKHFALLMQSYLGGILGIFLQPCLLFGSVSFALISSCHCDEMVLGVVI